uniref:ATP-binding cassette domain-containing protein n=1 Tax=Nonomuraea rhizosphaerae TaxID=2665663 RepID=UPI001C601E14
ARLPGLSRAGGRRRAGDLLDAFELTGAAGRPVGGYSGGMRRRLDIAAGLIVTPDLLFLDEPTTGLDPRSRGQVWELVRRIAAAGTTVLLTTQYLDEADRLAEQIAVIDHGRIVAEGTPAQLKARVGAGTLRIRLLDGRQRPRAREVLAGALEGTVHLAADPLALSMLLAAPTDGTAGGVADGTADGIAGGTAGEAGVGRLVGHAMTRLAEARVGVAEVALGQPSLDEAFLALTGHRTDPTPTGPATTTTGYKNADHEDVSA